jgi:hypothetical protein
VRFLRLYQAVALFSCLGLGQVANASLIINGSFESPASVGSPKLLPGSTELTGWTVINSEIAQICRGCFSLFPSDGNYFLDFTGYPDKPPYGGVEQIIPTVVGAVYSISFDIGARSSPAAGIQVSAGDLLTTAFSAIGGSQVWTTFSSTFTALDSQTKISFLGTQASWNGVFIGLDNVAVSLKTTDVPVPASLALFAAGLLGLGTLRRRAR